MRNLFHFYILFILFESCNYSENLTKESDQTPNSYSLLQDTLSYYLYDFSNTFLNEELKMILSTNGTNATYTILNKNDDHNNVIEITENINKLFLLKNNSKLIVYNFKDTNLVNHSISFFPFLSSSSKFIDKKGYVVDSNEYLVWKFHEGGELNNDNLKVTYYVKNFGWLIVSYYYLDRYYILGSVKNDLDTNYIKLSKLIIEDSVFFEAYKPKELILPK